MIFIDTDVAIALRDNHPDTQRRVIGLGEKPVISIMTRVELENGVNREPAGVNLRQQLLDRMLETIEVEYLTPADILAYGQIVYDFAHDRRLTIDRLIAAQAISRDARLVTVTGKDFRKIHGLKLEIWPSPTA